jgi:homoserine kinase type II
MAVFTPVNLDEAKEWLDTSYNLGSAIELQGINSGIENTNFFLTTSKEGTKREYVLTIFERLTAKQLPFYLELMEHLARKGVAVPAPARDKNNQILQSLKGKPAAIVDKLAGAPELAPQEVHCVQVGAMLAKMHLAGQDYKLHQPNLRSLPWWKETIPSVLPHISQSQHELLIDELNTQEAFFNSPSYQELPAGPSHCDLFRDNVLFKKHPSDQSPLLSGFFDFYFAGTDKWLFDLAVTVNDWCIDLKTGALDMNRAQALQLSYESIRPLSKPEQASWSLMLRAAALRFWISRLWDFYLPRDAQLLTPHDPTHFERILRLRREITNL